MAWEKVTLAEICRERGVSGDVFDLAYLEATKEWMRRTGGYIPALVRMGALVVDPEDGVKLRPTTTSERFIIARHWREVQRLLP